LITIVIADDHPIFRDGIRRLLATQGDMLVLGEAHDGTKTLDVVRDQKPQIALLDLKMAGMDGIQVLQELHRSKSNVSVILLTAEINDLQMMEALRLGAKGVLMKDVDTAALLDGIRAVAAGERWIVNRSESSIGLQSGHGAAKALPELSKRELQIVAAVVAGMSNRIVAEEFKISEDTVKHHLSNIFYKLNVSSRLELAVYALHHKLTGK
jgi:two-component system nitrate/nitrite response regulator NarL